MSTSFALVVFTEDDSVDVVPSVWLSSGKDVCFWPPFRSERLKNAIRKCESPLDSWTKCKVRVLHSFG